MSGADNDIERRRWETERGHWLQRLEEAAACPADHPDRLAVETELAARGGWAQAHWEGLLAEGASWGAVLEAVEPPHGLKAGLHTIAAQHAPQACLRRTARHRAAYLAAAAVALIGMALWAVLAAAPNAGEQGLEARVHTVALLALNDHLDTHEQDVLCDDAAALARDLQAHIPFPLDLPALGAAFQPVGGRRCTLGSHVVAFTAWRAPRGRLTLLQMRRGDFGLPADMPPRIVRPEAEAARGRPLDVFFFGRGDFVWVVVADEAADLRLVREVVTRS